MIHNQKKIRILDSIIVRDDLELIKHRISNSYPFVEWILLILPENAENLSQIKESVNQWSDKIKYFFSNDFEKIFNKENKDIFYQFLKSLNLGFEDIICFSEISELPDFNNFDNLSKELVFEPITLRNLNFIFNLTKHTKNKHMGTLCATYSILLNRVDILIKFSELKNRNIKDDFNVVDNGFNFEFFHPEEKIMKLLQIDDKTFYEDLSKSLNPKTQEDGIKSSFTDYESEIQFNTEFLNQYFYTKESSNKFLILFNMYQLKIEEDLISEYDRIFNFNFSDDYTLDEIKGIGSVENVNVFLPNEQLYDTGIYNFNLFFALNETKKLLKKFNLLNQQTLDIVILENGNSTTIESPTIWKDLKDRDFVKTFYDHLVPFI